MLSNCRAVLDRSLTVNNSSLTQENVYTPFTANLLDMVKHIDYISNSSRTLLNFCCQIHTRHG